ncbi:hypothetical protein GCM10010495_08140 [Kitasatospora herbaricolor]|uniref:hypothetical protein n=1 Tax=Kitasatospora herbaricolor TaxID=68217 RepID=UPI00174A2DE0|nr:hypothetical protein [Kitasatospora herbaricolor]MDQ0309750.1 hypothetical protein [Kitasatospora herbaricolor]GGU99851.1 hypothetical protein GCM10010495_08140 [Kitasatospora herbaricolor]
MTSIQSGADDSTPDPLNDRHLAECRCPMDCGGRPEAGLRLVSPYPAIGSVDAARVRPPAVPYVPRRVGETVRDVLSGRPGVFMGRLGNAVFLRPVSGGVEWDVEPRWIDGPHV